ncbi:GntR family transcriptional regulator [Fulvimarina endophytica]|uniref:GntR family transcriptional regulator n=1 Tax=Fulvimarina endophytica TaxID=2293836 RepID=A0A371WZ10_9HYPH|nr:GntR family transcriptional regulator [Fulvimarina endophytica]RFC62225.1 GntR family transcriptional regulator [Fulvimarina endophytica]
MSRNRADGWTDASPDDRIEQRPGLGDEVHERLVGDLVSLRLPPGERLSVDGLARRFGVSQTPIRGALIRLETEGLVVKKHNLGFFVAPLPTVERLEQVFEMRALIEPDAARKAARLASPSQLSDLKSIADEMQRLLAEDTGQNSTALVMLDSRFHTLIASACGNALLLEMLAKLFTQLHIFRVRIHSGIVEDVIAEHVTILEAIAARDEARASAMMKAHIDAARDRIEPHVRGAL